jgi:hypothetical protein
MIGLGCKDISVMIGRCYIDILNGIVWPLCISFDCVVCVRLSAVAYDCTCRHTEGYFVIV